MSTPGFPPPTDWRGGALPPYDSRNWWQRRSKGTKIAIGVTTAVFVIALITPNTPDTAPAQANQATSARPPATDPAAVDAAQRRLNPPPASPATTGAAASAAPAALIPGTGTYLIGTDITPGTYRAGVIDNAFWPNCYWARLRGTSGQLRDIIANDNTQAGTTVVTIAKSDVAFQSTGCTTWQRLN